MARRRRGRPVNGLLILDKPAGMSSNGALQRAKRRYDAAKAGHTGSLDPLATGVLPLCFGEATKFSQYVLEADKTYQSQFVLGVSTDTLDADGEVVARADASKIDHDQVTAVIKALEGPLEQVPPMYSALKWDGQPLYKLARQGIEVERKRRSVTLHRFDCLQFQPGEVATVDIEVHCTKGTYVRSLAESVGEALGVPAHVGRLRRVAAGPYTIEQAVTLEQLDAIEDVDGLLMPIDGPLQGFPAVELVESASFYLQRGQAVLVPNGPQNGMVRAYSASGEFLGMGEMLDDGRLAPRRLVNT